ncbi:MAG: hypothetical protein JWP58_2691 [Hymenobacter sp.]|nr:hypothetical protein [Hymenobacter sp.]
MTVLTRVRTLVSCEHGGGQAAQADEVGPEAQGQGHEAGEHLLHFGGGRVHLAGGDGGQRIDHSGEQRLELPGLVEEEQHRGVGLLDSREHGPGRGEQLEQLGDQAAEQGPGRAQQAGQLRTLSGTP